MCIRDSRSGWRTPRTPAQQYPSAARGELGPVRRCGVLGCCAGIRMLMLQQGPSRCSPRAGPPVQLAQAWLFPLVTEASPDLEGCPLPWSARRGLPGRRRRPPLPVARLAASWVSPLGAGNGHGQATSAPSTGRPLINARYLRAACTASAVVLQQVTDYRLPVADHHLGATARTGGRATRGVVDVAGIDVEQPIFLGDASRAGQRGAGGGRNVHHLVVRVERGEVQRHVRAELGCDPGGFGGELLI